MTSAYALVDFVSDLRRIQAEETEDRGRITRLEPLARQLSSSADLVQQHHYQCNPEQGFGISLLHEEPDHSLAVFIVAWLPGRGTPPHNHGTWAIVSGIKGYEHNIRWRREKGVWKPGSAKLTRVGEAVIGPGESISFLPADIHSVINKSEEVAISLHVYGRHLSHVERFQFDLARNREEPFKVVVNG